MGIKSKAGLKALGGIAPFGYRWRDGQLVIDVNEAPVRKLIYELFLKHRRKKTVAKILNDLGYRTRSASLFSDTTIDRLLRDPTAKGTKNVAGKTMEVEPIVSESVWESVNRILAGPRQTKQTAELFSGIAYCGCGGRMIVPANTPKYVCIDCRHKILKEDLVAIFQSQLAASGDAAFENLVEHWEYLRQKEKRIVIEQICKRIVIERDTITIRFGFGFTPHPKSMPDGQRSAAGNESPKIDIAHPVPVGFTEPLLSESQAATFLGISKTTLLRKRYASEINFFRLGHRVLYSKEKHLLPFLRECESATSKKPSVD